MIDKFCDWMSTKIKNSVENLDEERAMVIDFGVRLLFGEFPKIILVILIGFLLKIGWYTLLMFLLLAPYRSFTGGFHLKTHLGCMVTTTLLYIGPIALAKITPMLAPTSNYIIATLIGIMSIILITKYAPADTENVPILSKKERKSKRIKAYIALGILLAISLLVPDKTITYMLFYGMFLQNLTITPIAYKLTNNKHGYEVYQQESIEC